MLSAKLTCATADKVAFLNCRRLPARLNTSETALLLGFQEHDIAVLVGAGLLVPLGKPAPNAPKYFAMVQILAFAENVEWLTKATRTIGKRWREKNNRRPSALSVAA